MPAFLSDMMLKSQLLRHFDHEDLNALAHEILAPNAFSLRLWGRPKPVWLIDDRAPEPLPGRLLSDVIYRAERAIIICFASGRRPGSDNLRELMPCYEAMNSALDEDKRLLFVKTENKSAMKWVSWLTRIAPGCSLTILPADGRALNVTSWSS